MNNGSLIVKVKVCPTAALPPLVFKEAAITAPSAPTFNLLRESPLPVSPFLPAPNFKGFSTFKFVLKLPAWSSYKAFLYLPQMVSGW